MLRWLNVVGSLAVPVVNWISQEVTIVQRMLSLLLALLVGASAFAAQPEDVILPEILVGTLGGYAGAAIGAYTLSWAFSYGATGWDALARGILGAFLGVAGGTAVGSSLGVIATGWFFGIEGNAGLCFLCAAVGTGTVFGIGISLDILETILPIAPPIAAAGAMVGFNTGARSQP